LQAAAASGMPAASLGRLATWLPQGRVDRKREEAEEMLAAIRAHLDAGATALRVSWHMAETAAWRAAVAIPT